MLSIFISCMLMYVYSYVDKLDMQTCQLIAEELRKYRENICETTLWYITPTMIISLLASAVMLILWVVGGIMYFSGEKSKF